MKPKAVLNTRSLTKFKTVTNSTFGRHRVVPLGVSTRATEVPHFQERSIADRVLGPRQYAPARNRLHGRG